MRPHQPPALKRSLQPVRYRQRHPGPIATRSRQITKTIQHNLNIHDKGGPRNHFEFPYDIVIAEKERAYREDGNPRHLRYAESMQDDIDRLGGESEARKNPEFQMNYMCLWRESRVIAFKESTLARHAIVRLPRTQHPRPGTIQVAGLDIGKVNDYTVLTVGDFDVSRPLVNAYSLPGADEDKQIYYEKTITDWLQLRGSFEGNTGQYRQLVEYLRDTRVQVLVIDATALGDPVYERIEAMVGGSIICVPYKFSGISKALLYKYYLQEWNAGRLKFAGSPEARKSPEWQSFWKEHIDLDKVDHGSYATYEAPEGGHDDYPDSGALFCWAEKVYGEVMIPEIEVTEAPGRGGVERRLGDRDQEVVSAEAQGYRGGRAGRYR